jgi:DNA-binding transcriptional LysR family regulator
MSMALSQIQLEAFSEIAKLGSFTKAANSLALTQSALSHRIRHLEEELETSVFIRLGNKVRLTEAGTRLLLFCQVQSQAEEEFINEIKPRKNKRVDLSGRLRIGGVSSIMRSLVLPVTSSFIRENSSVRLDFLVKEISELPGLLSSGQVDFVISTAKIHAPGLDEVFLGYEENVLIRTAKKISLPDVYLDHDQDDQTTFDFLKHQGQKNTTIARSFLDDIYGLLDAVVEGIGQAVMPLHIVSQTKGIEIVGHFKSLLVPVYLYQYRQPYYTQLHQLAFKTLKQNVAGKLRSKT